MFGLVTVGRLRAADARAEQERAGHEQTRQELDRSRESRAVVSDQLESAHTALARRDEYVRELRGEISELLEKVRHLESPQAVHVLVRFGEVHSVHPSRQAAHTAAERHGAAPNGWGPIPAETVLRDLPWYVSTRSYRPASMHEGRDAS